MSPLEQLALGGHALGRTCRELSRASLWGPLVLLGAVEGAALLALAEAAHPAVSWALAGWVAKAGGPRALHYPDAFRTLPALFAGVDRVILWLAGSLAIGAATHGFVARWLGRPVSAWASLAAALRRWPALALAVLPAHALLLALDAWVALVAQAPGLVAMAVTAMAPFLKGLVVWLALLLPALVMRGHESAPRALWLLPHAWARAQLATVAPALAVLLPYAALGALTANPGLIVDRGRPEMVAVLLAVRVLAGLLGTFVLVGATALAYLGAVEEPA